MAELNDLFGEKFCCALCETEIIGGGKFHLCDSCYNGLDFISRACEKCGDKVNNFDRFCVNCKDVHRNFDYCVCVTKLGDTSKDLVYKLKYGKQPFVATAIAELMTERFHDVVLDNFDLVTYVPITRSKMKERGFNQTEIIAKIIADKLGFNFKKNLFLRIKDNFEQTQLDSEGRRKNLEGVFVIDDSVDLTGKSVLVIDDVYTTGATMQALNELLRDKHAEKVCGLMFCHA